MAYLAVYKNGKKTHDGWFAGDKNDKVVDLLKKYQYMDGDGLKPNVTAADLYTSDVVGYKKVFNAKKYDSLNNAGCFSNLLRSNDKEEQKEAEVRLKRSGNVAVVLDTK